MSEEALYRFRSELLPKAVFQASLVFLVATVLALGVNQFRTSGIPLVVDWSPEARLKAATGDGMVIPLNEAAGARGRTSDYKFLVFWAARREVGRARKEAV